MVLIHLREQLESHSHVLPLSFDDMSCRYKAYTASTTFLPLREQSHLCMMLTPWKIEQMKLKTSDPLCYV